MGMKDFDLKGFVLHKGEKFGLIVAGGLMVVLIGLGVSRAARSGSPNATASELDSISKSAQQRISASDPTGTPIADQSQLARVLTFDRIDPSQFPVEFPFLLSASQEDLKRRSPEVQEPSEFHVEVVKGAFLGHYLTVSKDGRIRVQILVDKQFSANQYQSMNRGYGRQLGSPGGRSGAMGGAGMGGGGDDRSSGGAPGGMGFPGMGASGLPGMGGMPGGGEGMPGMGGMFGDLGSRKAFKSEMVDTKELEQKPDAKLAETLYPVRMVVVSASFPYKEQWEEFRRKLRRRSLAEVIQLHSEGNAPFQFTGYELQRQEYGPDGKLIQEWTDFTKPMEESLKWLFVRASRFEDEDEKLMRYADFGVLNERLVIPRPLLAKQQKYPKEELKDLDKAIAELDKLAKDTTPPPVSDRQRKLSGDFDIFNPLSGDQEPQMMGMGGERGEPGMGPAGMGAKGGRMGGGMGPGGLTAGGGGPAGMFPGRGGVPGPGGMMAGGPGSFGHAPGGPRGGDRRGSERETPGGMPGGYDPYQQNQEPVLPDTCLVRFIDPTVKPGHSYEYRIRIKMANPNYQQREELLAYKSLAKDKEIVAKEWTPVPGRITVPGDLSYFVVDEKPEKGPLRTPGNQDRIALQIHRWLDTVVTSPTASQIRVAVGDWTIWEHVLVYRGEYIGRTHEEKVPIWETTIEDYIMARNTSAKRNQVPVDFSTRLSLKMDPALLVDFQQGGQVPVQVGGRNVRDEFQWQALILTPDGKLVLRNGREDTENQERQERVKEHREWVKKVESGQRVNPFPLGLPGGGRGGGGPGGSGS